MSNTEQDENMTSLTQNQKVSSGKVTDINVDQNGYLDFRGGEIQNIFVNQDGTLYMRGMNLTANDITINSGGSLQIGATTNAPNNSAAPLAINNLTLNKGATFVDNTDNLSNMVYYVRTNITNVNFNDMTINIKSAALLGNININGGSVTVSYRASLGNASSTTNVTVSNGGTLWLIDTDSGQLLSKYHLKR